jgi:hypothetical protein
MVEVAVAERSTGARPVSDSVVGPETLTPESLFVGDPVHKFLHDRVGGTLTVALHAALAALVFFGGAYLNGGLFNNTYDDLAHAALFDRTTSLRKILLIALGLSVYFLLPRLVAALFNNLRDNSVLAGPRRASLTYGRFLEDMAGKMNWRLWPVLGVLTVVWFWAYRYFTHDPAKRKFWLEIAALVAYSLGFYVFVPTLAKLWIVVFSTNRLFRLFKVRVIPLHPDGAGGFGPVGRMFSTYVLIFTAFGLLVAAGMISSYYRTNSLFKRSETWMLIVGYTSLPVLLWGWLWAPHKAMREVRDRKLLLLAEEFHNATTRHDADGPADAPPPEESADLKASIERLSELKRQHDLLIDSYPTWPVRFRQANRLAALISAPLITTALPHIIYTLRLLLSKR